MVWAGEDESERGGLGRPARASDGIKTGRTRHRSPLPRPCLSPDHACRAPAVRHPSPISPASSPLPPQPPRPSALKSPRGSLGIAWHPAWDWDPPAATLSWPLASASFISRGVERLTGIAHPAATPSATLPARAQHTSPGTPSLGSPGGMHTPAQSQRNDKYFSERVQPGRPQLARIDAGKCPRALQGTGVPRGELDDPLHNPCIPPRY